MDDFMALTQGDRDQQERVTELLLRAIKEIFPSVPGEFKDSVSLKKALQGDGSWLPVKEILGWILDTSQGTLQLPEKRRQELRQLLQIPASQRRISVDKLRRLIGKLRSLHLAVPGAIGHFYHLQTALTQAGSGRRAYMSKGFHRDIAHWNFLCNEVLSQPTYIAEIVQRLWTAMGFCDASGKGAGGVWIDPNADGESFVWRLQWPSDITADLVSWENPQGRITNSDLELAALVLHEACFPSVCVSPHWHAPATGSDNTPTVSWAFKESSTINPVVAELLRIRSEQNRLSKITPSVFYHPGSENTMADDASRRFDLTNEAFLPFFTSRYSPQSAGSWTVCHPPTEIVSSVISALRKLPSGGGTFPTNGQRLSMPTGSRSAPTTASAIGSIALPTQWSRSFRCSVTGSRTDITPKRVVSGRTRLLRRGGLSPRPTSWKAGGTPENPWEWQPGS